MSAKSIPDIVPEIKNWLEREYEKNQPFCLFADWRTWARYELYMHLEKIFGAGENYLVQHDIPVCGERSSFSFHQRRADGVLLTNGASNDWPQQFDVSLTSR